MSGEPAPTRRVPWIAYLLVAVLTAAATALGLALLMNIWERKVEGRQTHFELVALDENSVDPAIWGRNFPRQYDSYKRTVDTVATKYGGSEAFAKDHLQADPRLKRIFAGYAFSIDYREERGHAYMLSDQDETERVKAVKQPGACLHCHASVLPAYREAGGGDVMKGFEKVCAMPLAEARKLVEHPVTCLDCHDPKSIQLRVTRPGFLNGIDALAKDPGAGPAREGETEAAAARRREAHRVPHLSSVERFRQRYWAAAPAEREKMTYDPNREATRQEMRSFVCGQCHVEYYFKGPGKRVTYPWAKGLKMDDIEAYYDEENFSDWTHKETGAKVLKAQHPEFEMWSQGLHARSGVACADCHMPYVREGAIKVSLHHVRSPLLHVNLACQTCHRTTEDELKSRVETIQDRTRKLLDRAEDALVALYDTIAEAKAAGASQARIDAALKRQRQAQWRVDFVSAENSMGFHASQESARILAEAIDMARLGQVELLKGK